MQNYHKVWLENHPERDEEWLMTALNAGFDIHHLDGNHENDEFRNLVLVEHSDHMRMHDNPSFGVRGDWESRTKKINLGKDAYSLRETGLGWKEVEEQVGYVGNMKYGHGSYAINAAKAYAKYHKKTWPIPHIDDCTCTKCLKDKKENLICTGCGGKLRIFPYHLGGSIAECGYCGFDDKDDRKVLVNRYYNRVRP